MDFEKEILALRADFNDLKREVRGRPDPPLSDGRFALHLSLETRGVAAHGTLRVFCADAKFKVAFIEMLQSGGFRVEEDV